MGLSEKNHTVWKCVFLPKITMAPEDSSWTHETQSRRSQMQRPVWLQCQAWGCVPLGTLLPCTELATPPAQRWLSPFGQEASRDVTWVQDAVGRGSYLWVSCGLDVAIFLSTSCQLLWGLWELINLVDLRLTLGPTPTNVFWAFYTAHFGNPST